MLLYDKNLQPLNVAQLKADIKADLENTPIPEQDDLESDLGGYYDSAIEADSAQYGIQTNAVDPAPATTGKGILQKIKDFICSLLTDASNDDDIIDAILKALASVIPGGIIFQFIAKKLIKFILNLGIGGFCPVLAPALAAI